jgi:acyl-coenzyme A synthetase/AMP-(fatty) acid ligase
VFLLLLPLAPLMLQWIIRHTLFGGLLTGATVVVVTKHPSVIQAAQLVVAMQHGRAVFTGSPSAYANWRAKQTAAAASAGAVSNGWTPLIR